MPEEEPSSIRSELLERLRAMEGPQSSDSLAELAYRRAREALERALDESRLVRLQAIEDAKATRERELTALMEALRSLRQSAEAQIEALVRSAEIEAVRIRDQSRSEAQANLDRAANEAAQIRAEAMSMRVGADERAREVERLEADFNELLARVVERLGITERPNEGWLRRLTGNH